MEIVLPPSKSRGMVRTLSLSVSLSFSLSLSRMYTASECLFWTGVRAQEQRVSAGTRDGMLGVRGLTPEQLEVYVKIVRSVISSLTLEYHFSNS